MDTAYIGMLHSDEALAAVVVTLPLLLIMVSVENIFAAGAAVLAGRQLGAGGKEDANRTVTTIAALSMMIGILLCVLGIVFIEPLLKGFGASDAVLPQAKDYAFWMFVAAVFNLPAQSLNCAARAESSVKISCGRRGAQRSSGSCVHVFMGIEYGRRGSFFSYDNFSVRYFCNSCMVLSFRALYYQDQTGILQPIPQNCVGCGVNRHSYGDYTNLSCGGNFSH